ncbi:hydrogenase maturation protease [Synechococcus elongatus]|uniref:Hydrogenase maturation protease n=2 Tax=Synechococcus elongatus TaxID=32046 RepID=Q31K35_SYNE7|nr:hydrogenase maturation protease [Synechococcus elongatus]ABB58584.1 conserved hypothetical protein [Synechococcus elongatus PCC 7942 = FACHB-805]AJD56963.1 hypothetical protein M744_03435 [Synechococcus elongatus UTEX 2973]MBD2587304.1 hydrogenase maturation protease [Synechococcus elongatus FACHB-242]MBD2688373.1 hydrogenase maturation protease [Synechococcus elongatus FACHB-1061]MBD2705915.1 hydrogenase maturation protease [Synechococcus elongatus PCC 7942 = FACHB-805]
MCLVIGYGNALRSDDGAGIAVAEAIARWPGTTFRAIACHQVLPELAAELATVPTVIFVDAYPAADCTDGGVEMRRLSPDIEASMLSPHDLTPAALLGLCERLYGHCPTAYWVLIPGHDWHFSEQLSPATQSGVQQALWLIRHWNDQEVLCTN